MAKYGILLAVLITGGLAFPAPQDGGLESDQDMSIFFDHTHPDTRIVGGTVAANGAYPWMVALTNGNSRSFLCGGSVVTNRRVVSAAHCIVAAAPGGVLSRTLRVTVGTNRWSSGGRTYNTNRHSNHPHYNPNTLKNDIGVLWTSSNIVMNNNVRAIPLNYNYVGANVPVRVSGWGNTLTGGLLSPNLLELRMNTVDGNRCISEVQRLAHTVNMRVPPVDPRVEICTFLAVNRGACNGDSGSPLVRNSDNQQIGVVSWGLPCARGAPDMFARISAFNNWLPLQLW